MLLPPQDIKRELIKNVITNIKILFILNRILKSAQLN
jgi:hypothetical protein